MLSCVRYISFSSAGMKAPAYLGAIDALEDALGGEEKAEEFRERVKGVSGSSAGTLACLVFVLGFGAKKRFELIHKMTEMQKHFNPDLALLLRNYGWEDGATFKELVRETLSEGGMSPDSTLGDVKRLLRKDIVCACTNLGSAAPVYLSGSRTPYVKVVDAIYSSCCVPFVFTPQVVDGEMYVDGCLTDDHPNVFAEEETLFVGVDRHMQSYMEIDTWATFLSAIVRCHGTCQDEKMMRIKERVGGRYVEIEDLEEMKGMPSMKVDMTKEEANKIYRNGYACCLNALLPEKEIFRRTGEITMAVSDSIKNTYYLNRDESPFSENQAEISY